LTLLQENDEVLIKFGFTSSKSGNVLNRVLNKILDKNVCDHIA